jgi:hypothetical protein
MRNFAFAFMLLLLAPATARAQDFEAAGKHFGAAQDAFGKKFFKTAATEFQAAYEITKDPILLYNIGEAWQKSGEGKKAVTAYKAYLKAQPNAQDKAEVLKRVKLIETKKFKLASESAPGDAEAFAALSAPPPVAKVEPPPPPVPVTPPPPLPPIATPPPKVDTVLPLAPEPAPEPAKTEAPPPPPAPASPGLLDERPASKMRVVAWVGVAATVAVLTAGAIFGLAAQSRGDEISRRFSFVDSTGQPKTFDQTAQNDIANLRDEGKLYNGLSIGFFSAAGALAVATTVLFVVDYKNHKPEAKKSALKLTPALGKDGGGVAAAWSF